MLLSTSFVRAGRSRETRECVRRFSFYPSSTKVIFGIASVIKVLLQAQVQDVVNEARIGAYQLTVDVIYIFCKSLRRFENLGDWVCA